MNPEEVAAKYSKRAGFRLISYREVALPIWRISLRAMIAAEKPLAPFDEFVLRAIDEEFAGPNEMAGILGVEESLVVGVAAELLRNDCIHHVPGGAGGTRLSLTTKGTRQLEDAISIVPAEQQVTIDFDALKWKLVPSGDWYLKPHDVKEAGIVELPRAKKRPPEVEDLRIEDVDAMIKEGSGRMRLPGRVLALKAIESRQRMFRRAVALVFRGAAPDDIHVDFAIDGVIEPDVAQHFRSENLFSRLGIDVKKGIPDAADELKRQLEADGIQPSKSLTSMILETNHVASATASPAESSQQEPAVETFPESTPKAAATSAPAPKVAPTKAVEVPTPPTAGPAVLGCYEHPDYLRSALHSAARRILIVSPWVKRTVVNRRFIRDLEECLSRGVDVYIGWGIEKLSEDDIDIDHDVKAEFARLQRSFHSSFYSKRLGTTHSKILICDSDFAIVTSFNWLSFRGDPSRTIRDERGVLIRDRDEIEGLFKSEVARFG